MHSKPRRWSLTGATRKRRHAGGVSSNDRKPACTTHLDLVPMLKELGWVFRHSDRPAQANATLERVVRIHEAVHGPEHPEVARTAARALESIPPPCPPAEGSTPCAA